jgi:threonine dehydrogenase-like Zn-dependent dehydrogenase
MKALAITAPGRAAFVDVPEPEPGPGEVLLAVRHVGLCGSDLNTFLGRNPLVALPRIPGHEISATILGKGAGVPEAFAPGRGVIVIPYTTCGRCTSCRAGRENACRYNRTLGVQQDGGLGERLRVHHDRLILDDALPEESRALVEPLSVGFHAVRRGRVAAGETVLVLGAGMIGTGVILGARAAGARVIVSDVAEEKRPLLARLGVTEFVNPERQDLAAAIAALTDDQGADVVVEAVGLPATFRAAIDLAAFAGRVVYVGYAKEAVSYDTSRFNLKELDIMGSRNATRADFDAVVAFLAAHPEIADAVITRRFPWPDADGALDFWQSHRPETMKIVISLG